jgi:hypothetical protein
VFAIIPNNEAEVSTTVALLPHGANGPNPVILSAAKNPASIAVQPRFFAALRMTVFRLLQTIRLVRVINDGSTTP